MAKVAQRARLASTLGIATIEARLAYAPVPTAASRVLPALADHGETVKAGQLVTEFDTAVLMDRVVSGGLAAGPPAQRDRERAPVDHAGIGKLV